MLTEQRYDIILKLLEEKNSITVAEVKELLNTSESTVRRDITALHNAGKLVKVFGGAVACDRTVVTHEPTVEQKAAVNVEEKQLTRNPAAARALAWATALVTKMALFSVRKDSR